MREGPSVQVDMQCDGCIWHEIVLHAPDNPGYPSSVCCRHPGLNAYLYSGAIKKPTPSNCPLRPKALRDLADQMDADLLKQQDKKSGPTATVKTTCKDCVYKTVEHVYNADVAEYDHYVSCQHPDTAGCYKARYAVTSPLRSPCIGVDKQDTPEWCPLRGEALLDLAKRVSEGKE